MTVRELIARLENCDQDAMVFWDGVTAGIPSVDEVESRNVEPHIKTVWLLNEAAKWN